MQYLRVTSVVVAIVLALLLPLPVRALDVQVSSTTSTQIYEIQGVESGVFLTRRRVTERLTLQLSRVLPREAEDGYQGPKISASLMLRIDSDFGHSGSEIRPTSEFWFVPGYDPYALDLMVAELVVRDLFRRSTDIRAGRLISFDPTGFSALDGAEISFRLPWHIRLWTAAGVDVIAGQRLSSGSFETDGILHMRRDELLLDEYTEYEDPPTRVVIAGGAALTDIEWLALDVAFRQGIIPEDQRRTSFQRLAGTAAVRLGMFRGGVTAGGDFALGKFDELGLELGLRPLSWFRFSLAARYEAPVFDVDSIFAAFWSDPSVNAELRSEFRPWYGLILGLVGRVAQLGFLPPDGDVFDSDGLNYGGSLYGQLRWRWLIAELRGRIGLGYGGDRASVMTRILATLPGRRLVVDLRGILLGYDDDLDPADHVVSLGYVVGARYLVSHDVNVLFEFEHNASHELGQQFRFLVLLDLGIWI